MMSARNSLNFQTAVLEPAKGRSRSVRSKQAQAIAVELRTYFRSIAQLAAALGTSRDTLRAWTAGTVPSRPRVELLDAAQSLLVLCRAARRYMPDDHQVGDWVTAPDPRLRGASPAKALRRYGRPGLDVLVSGLALIAPSRPTGPVELPPLDELRAALMTGIGPEAVERIEQMAAVEPIVLTDAEIGAELAAVGEDEPAVEAKEAAS